MGVKDLTGGELFPRAIVFNCEVVKLRNWVEESLE
ncbi:hypothetical protein ES703_70439 [subsurface metagenome]